MSSSLTKKELFFWKVGRAVKCAGLENQSTFRCTGGSNPSPSATVNPTLSWFLVAQILRIANGELIEWSIMPVWNAGEHLTKCSVGSNPTLSANE